MCRRLIIECEWDDSEGNPGMFDVDQDYNQLTDFAENVLIKEITGMFDGQVTIRIEKMNG